MRITDPTTDAVAAVTRAERELADADAALAEAREQLDQALASKGWRRVYGGFDARLYAHVTRPGYLTPLEQVLEVIELERRAAA